MILKTQHDITPAVLGELDRIDDPRIREIMKALVTHLHAFAREVQLTEAEFQRAAAYVNALGQKSGPDHNEAILMAGTLGLSSLVCLLNNGNNGQTETTANLLGPFWRTDSPDTENGASIVRSPTPGTPMFATITVLDDTGGPVPDATVDVWHSSSEGFYENQDPGQAEWNLRGKFTSDTKGQIRFRSIKPVGYPIPVDGPVGELVKLQKRHNMRPAHIHFMVCKPGFKTHISQVYSGDDPNLETDVQFGVTERLVADYVAHDAEAISPDGHLGEPWCSIDFSLRLDRGDMVLPRPPITAKAVGARPQLEVLDRA